MGLVVVDGNPDGVVAGPRSRLARLDGPAHTIVEGARDGPTVLVGVRVDLVAGQRAAGRAAGVGLGLRGVGPAVQRFGGLHGGVATAVIAEAVAGGRPVAAGGAAVRASLPAVGADGGGAPQPIRVTAE